jgi:superfamily II DNA/RNA helicase
VLVLDEADQLLSLGFKKELAALLAALEPTAAARQTLLFSATLPAAVMSVAHVACRHGAAKLIDAVGAGQLQTNVQVTQMVTITSHAAQAAELLALLRELAAADHRHVLSLTQPSSNPNPNPNASPSSLPLPLSLAPSVALARSRHKVIVFFATARMLQLHAQMIRGATAGGRNEHFHAQGHAQGGEGAADLRVLEIHSRLSQAARTHCSLLTRLCRCGHSASPAGPHSRGLRSGLRRADPGLRSGLRRADPGLRSGLLRAAAARLSRTHLGRLARPSPRGAAAWGAATLPVPERRALDAASHPRRVSPSRHVASEFRASSGVVLFSTDVSARGVDYPDVTAVVQVEG